MARLLVVVGLGIALIGALLWVAPRSLRWMGRLPGDIRTDHFSFPIVTCLLISAVLTLVVNVVLRLLR